MAEAPVTMLETMSGRISSFSIRIRISPGKAKYCWSRLDRLAYFLSTTPRHTPGREDQRTNQKAVFPIEEIR